MVDVLKNTSFHGFYYSSLAVRFHAHPPIITTDMDCQRFACTVAWWHVLICSLWPSLWLTGVVREEYAFQSHTHRIGPEPPVYKSKGRWYPCLEVMQRMTTLRLHLNSTGIAKNHVDGLVFRRP